MKDIYNDRTYLAHNPGWHAEDAPFKAGRVLELLRRRPVPHRTIAEVGCGSGAILIELARHLPDADAFVGHDISADAIAIARRHQHPRVRFELGDFTATGDDGPHDLVLVIDVIEHLRDYFTFLDGIRPKGRHTIFHIPLDMCLWALLREAMLIESKERVGHIHNFTEDFILSILADHGFEVLDKIYTPPVHKDPTARQRLVNAVRKAMFRIAPRFTTKTLGGYSIMVLARNRA
ncbi:MAG: methyltransferase domain-containing protein [Flavobacteriales bacterium]|jgi:predicted TPR repeat methyltransferase|nr:methyltransferase domain-containing protein [Flavobacteriales bacterium]